MTGAVGRRSWTHASRRQLVVLLVSTLLGTGLLLWGGDRLARGAAESLVVRELQRLTGTPDAPEVDVRGSSFLVQAVRGRYEQVDVALTGLTSGPLRIERLDARLSGVRLPLSELLLRNPDVMAVERATGRAVLTYADLDRYLEFTGRPYTVRPGSEPQEVELAGQVRVLDRVYDVTVHAAVDAEAGALTVTPVRLDTGSQLDRPAEVLLSRRFTFVVPLDPLPFGQRVVDLEVGRDAIVVHTETEGLVLRPR